MMFLKLYCFICNYIQVTYFWKKIVSRKNGVKGFFKCLFYSRKKIVVL